MILTTYGLTELNNNEVLQVEGGSKGFWSWLVKQIIDNWDEIKQGASDGWNGRPYNPPTKS
ncbi:MAG: hypothetical protein QM594_07190 [Niabella sp.]